MVAWRCIKCYICTEPLTPPPPNPRMHFFLYKMTTIAPPTQNTLLDRTKLWLYKLDTSLSCIRRKKYVWRLTLPHNLEVFVHRLVLIKEQSKHINPNDDNNVNSTWLYVLDWSLAHQFSFRTGDNTRQYAVRDAPPLPLTRSGGTNSDDGLHTNIADFSSINCQSG